MYFLCVYVNFMYFECVLLYVCMCTLVVCTIYIYIYIYVYMCVFSVYVLCVCVKIFVKKSTYSAMNYVGYMPYPKLELQSAM